MCFIVGTKGTGLFGKQSADDKKQKILKQQFRKKLEPVFMERFLFSLEASGLPQFRGFPFDQPEFPCDSMLTETSKQVLKLQEASESAFTVQPRTIRSFEDFESTLVILLDIGASEHSLFKVSDRLQFLMTLLRKTEKDPNFCDSLAIFLRVLSNLGSVHSSAGTTNYEAPLPLHRNVSVRKSRAWWSISPMAFRTVSTKRAGREVGFHEEEYLIHKSSSGMWIIRMS